VNRLAALLTLLLAAAVAHAADEPLKALVLEHKDPHTNVTGAREALEAAGFEVDDLPTKRSASSLRADVIILGSFSSEHPEWWRYARSKVDGLQRFVEKGGVVIQMTQASGTEEAPPFLPEGVRAIRHKGDDEVLRVTGRHPLTDALARDAEDAAKLACAKWRGRAPSWHGLLWWEGMRVLVTAGEGSERAALLEAAHGKGRFLVSSLYLDKKKGDKDEPAAQEQFLSGLAAYVRAVKAGTAPDVEPTPPPGETVPELGDPVPAPHGLAISDVVVYERRPVTRKGGAVVLGEEEPWTITGSDLRARRYAPVDARRGNLPAILAFRLTPSDAADETVELELPIRDVTPLEVTGEIASRAVTDAPDGKRQAWVSGTFAFESGRSGKKDKNRIEKGTGTTTALVDLDEGVVLHARAEIFYELVNLNAKRGVKPKAVTNRFDWRHQATRRARYEGHHEDIAKCIERGVEWLRGERQDDGLWKPHGGYKIGTQALIALTLAACDVPRDDPLLVETVDWIFTQKPKKTYERATALMAIDEFYAPPGERNRLREGVEPAPRKLPKDRQRWCDEVAAELEKTATQPGSWGYPPTARVIPNFDTSNTQYAILGLHAATHLGYEPDEGTWLGIMRHFELVKERDAPKGSVAIIRAGAAIRDESKTTLDAAPVREVAGFRYTTLKGPREVWSSMTCAGIASLSICRHQLRRIGSKKLTPAVENEIEETILGAWAWLDVNWATDRHPHHPGNQWLYYYLYSLERAGILHGVKRVGGKDWYFEGAAQLLARQKEKGGWAKGKDAKVAETCFALLFLKRATAPLTGR
jgi:hypothetical protein